MTQNRDDGVDVTLALKALRKRAGLSMEALATSAGYKGASSIQRYENPEHFHKKYLPYDVLERFASVLVGKGFPPISAEEVFALGGPVVGAAFPLEQKWANPANDGGGEVETPVRQIGIVEARDLPILDTERSERASGGFVLGDNVVEYARRPASLAGVKEAFAFYVPVNTMEPKLPEGSLQVVHPNKRIRVGDDVLLTVKLIDADAPMAYLLRISSLTSDQITGHGYRQPDTSISLNRADIVQMCRLLYVEDLIG